MRDKRTHRNYARNSLNLTFLLRYTGPACSEVTNFIGKRPIYRSPRSHTISAPPRARRVYTERARMRMRLHSDSVHTDSNGRFSWIPELPPNARLSTIDDGSFPTDLRYRTLSPGSVEINVADLRLPFIPIADITRGARVWDRHPRIFEFEISSWRMYTDRYFERGEKETRRIRDKVEIRGNHGFCFLIRNGYV